jgi:hypothetical protein
MPKKTRIKQPGNLSKTKGRIPEPSSKQLANYDDSHPIFCLRYLDDEYNLNGCTKNEKAHFADALRKRSQMSWQDIKMAPRRGLGLEKIDRNTIKAPIPNHITEDIEHFIAIRFCGKAPMVGYRSNDIFRIIWLDSKFTLYDHE